MCAQHFFFFMRAEVGSSSLLLVPHSVLEQQRVGDMKAKELLHIAGDRWARTIMERSPIRNNGEMFCFCFSFVPASYNERNKKWSSSGKIVLKRWLSPFLICYKSRSFFVQWKGFQQQWRGKKSKVSRFPAFQNELKGKKNSNASSCFPLIARWFLRIAARI